LQTISRDRLLLWAILVALAVRIVIFIGTIFWPVPNESLLPVSPLHPPGYQDFQFYLMTLQRYSTVSLGTIFNDFIAFYQRPFEQQFGHIIAGPVFPGLVAIFDYRVGSTLPFATFFLVLSSATAALWLKWMAQFPISRGWLFLFAVAPNPIWFMLVLSPDALFAFLICAFYLSYFHEHWSRQRVISWVCIVILILLTRPNGYSILLFVLLDMTVRHIRHDRHHILGVIGIVIMAVAFALYLYPYFITEMRKAIGVMSYFGIPSSEYSDGIFSILPEWIDVFFSWVALFSAKLLYFVGLRPTYGETSIGLVAVRAAAGIVLLPGLIYASILLPRRQRLFVALFCLPILLGPTQDRYNLPIFPLLFLYGALAYEAVFRRAARMIRLVLVESRDSRGL